MIARKKIKNVGNLFTLVSIISANYFSFDILIDMADKQIGRVTAHYPKFVEEQFSCLCSEFKQLYVAVTRARQNLFIFDSDTEVCVKRSIYILMLCNKTSSAMVQYWLALGLVNIITQFDDPALLPLKQKSKPAKWNAMV